MLHIIKFFQTGAQYQLEWNSDSLVAQAVLLFLAETALAAENKTGHNDPVANLHALDLGPNVLHIAHELVAKDVALFHPGLRKNGRNDNEVRRFKEVEAAIDTAMHARVQQIKRPYRLTNQPSYIWRSLPQMAVVVTFTSASVCNGQKRSQVHKQAVLSTQASSSKLWHDSGCSSRTFKDWA